MALAICCSAPGLTAQAAAGSSTGRPELRHVVAVQPLWTLVQIYSAEYEQLVDARSVALGVNVTYDPVDISRLFSTDRRSTYFSAEVKVRRFLEGTGMHGASLGAGAGVVHTYHGSAIAPELDERRTRPTLGGELAYDTVIDDAGHVRLSSGVGVKWRFGRHDVDEYRPLYATLRLALGYAF